MNTTLCYLDNAATSFPKPSAVCREVTRCMIQYCGNAGRGSHRLALRASEKIYECRELISSLINAPSEEHVIFVPSCTYGLNLIIKGLLSQGDHVLISDMEHNAVWRPIERLKREGIITYDTFCALGDRAQDDDALLNGIKKKLRKNTKLLICTHSSNVCSYSLPVAKIGELCKNNHVLFALDVAQTIGHYKIDMQNMNINFISAPSHKGLLGPQGSGFIAINSKELPNTLIEGGNGVFSLDPTMTDILPERYEAGTMPLPCIAGLCEGIKYLLKYGIDAVQSHERKLYRLLRDELLNMSVAEVYAPEFEGNTLLFNLQGIPPERVCAILDENGICVRGGFHCAALAHASLGTEKTGAIRASFSINNTEKDVFRLVDALNRIKNDPS